MSKPTNVRCAIYTRKSTEEGLEQDFNSLHAQREACSSYILSQRSEGWLELPERFDDGGFSGGTLDRPALQQLMAKIDAGEVDVVVVYKIDRLTRSLLDFAKLIGQFERRLVTFVSVTQSFNTTTSMGRLTLNMLLSFAQFERELTSKRIRDKVAASKKKGIWMGGYPPLGYDIGNRRLNPNPAEVETVNYIFKRYIELGCIEALLSELKHNGITSKRWTSSTGATHGGQVFGRSVIYHLLNNRVYLGETVHKGAIYTGEHPAIVSRDLFVAVQERLALSRRRTPGKPTSKQSTLLEGLLFDSVGRPMTPTFTRNHGRNYTYYVRMGRAEDDGDRNDVRRVRTSGLDDFVRRILHEIGLPAAHSNENEETSSRAYISRVELHPQSTKVFVDRTRALEWWRAHDPSASGAKDDELIDRQEAELGQAGTLSKNQTHLVFTIPMRAQFRGGAAAVISPPGTRRPKRDTAMIKALAKAYLWKQKVVQGEINSLDALAKHLHKERRYVTGILRLAFLSPTLTKAILEGRQPRELRLAHLLEANLPLSWNAQSKQFGIVD